MYGKPVIEGTRITVELIMERVAAGWTIDEIRDSYPHLTREQIAAVLDHAAGLVRPEAPCAIEHATGERIVD
jgi:uncharacterized protein (DUF433 family)